MLQGLQGARRCMVVRVRGLRDMLTLDILLGAVMHDMHTLQPTMLQAQAVAHDYGTH
jgi:hypothetical protein